MFTLNYASFLIPYFNLLFLFFENGLALSDHFFAVRLKVYVKEGALSKLIESSVSPTSTPGASL